MTPRRPLVFLGIEGVISLVTPEVDEKFFNLLQRGRAASAATVESFFDAPACDNLRKLQAEFGAQFVLTSFYAEAIKKSQLSKFFEQAGLNLIVEHMHQHWCSPFTSWSVRAEEIDDWLRLYGRGKSTFVILDSPSNGRSLLRSRLLANTVFCDQSVGFGPQELKRAREILRNHEAIH